MGDFTRTGDFTWRESDCEMLIFVNITIFHHIILLDIDSKYLTIF